MKKLLFSLLAAFLITGCQFLDSSDEIVVDEIFTEPVIEKQLEIEKPTTDLKGEDKLVRFYAATICSFVYPAFWDGLWAGENGWKDPESIDTNNYYQQFGYDSEAEAEAEAAKFGKNSSFKKKLKTKLDSLCAGSVSETDLQEILDNL